MGRSEEIKEKWGIERVDQVIDMLGLCGDVSDNIPGVPGIGPKTAEKLLAKYDTVEGLLAHVDELKGKQQEKVREHADQARLSKKLATIQLDVPLDCDWDALQLAPPDQEKLVPIFTEFEFRTLGKRIFGNDFSVQEAAQDLVLQGEDDGAHPGSRADQIDLLPETTFKKLADHKTNYRTVRDASGLAALVEALQAAGKFAFDTETTALNPRSAELVGLSFSTRSHQGWWVPCSKATLDALRPVFADATLTKIGHNLKFDLAILAEQNCPVAGPCYDTMLAHALIDPEQRHNLDVLAEDILSYSTIRFSELFPETKKGETLDYAGVEPQALANYAIEDADIALQLWETFAPLLEKSGQAEVFYDIETPLLPAPRRDGARGHSHERRHAQRHRPRLTGPHR